jgi:hypothetical protein
MVGQWGDSTEKYDIFFFEDLTPQLKPTFDFSQANDNNKIEIPAGSYAIPFHFSIPRNALESYQGRHAQTKYELEIGADMGPWKKDYHHTLPFEVTNPKMDYKVGDRYYLDKESDKKEGQPYLDLEFGTKDDVVDELPKFRCGEIIKGRLKMGNTSPRVRRAIIELYSIEYARWGPTRTVFDNIKKQVTYDQNTNTNTVAFEIQLPESAKRSFNANHSEFYWLLEAKVDISGSPDIHAKRVIQIA